LNFLHDIYLIGSLRNPVVPEIEKYLVSLGMTVFCEWFAGGERADEAWREYEQFRGNTFTQALKTYYAKHIFEFDKFHIDNSQAGVLVLPAGRSGHLELGYMMGQGKPGYILLDKDPERYDIMYQFANGVYTNKEELAYALSNERFCSSLKKEEAR